MDRERAAAPSSAHHVAEPTLLYAARAAVGDPQHAVAAAPRHQEAAVRARHEVARRGPRRGGGDHERAALHDRPPVRALPTASRATPGQVSPSARSDQPERPSVCARPAAGGGGRGELALVRHAVGAPPADDDDLARGVGRRRQPGGELAAHGDPAAPAARVPVLAHATPLVARPRTRRACRHPARRRAGRRRCRPGSSTRARAAAVPRVHHGSRGRTGDEVDATGRPRRRPRGRWSR